MQIYLKAIKNSWNNTLDIMEDILDEMEHTLQVMGHTLSD